MTNLKDFEPFLKNREHIGMLEERNRIAKGLLDLTGDTVDRLAVLQFVVYPFLYPTIGQSSSNMVCPNHEGGFDCTSFCRLCEGEQEFNPNDLTVCDKCPKLITKGIYVEELGMCLDCSNDYYNHKEEGF